LVGGVKPDHSKFCRLRQALDAEGDLDLYMLLVIDEAVSLGLIKGRTIVADGTKIATCGSQWRKYLDEAEAADAQDSAGRASEQAPAEPASGSPAEPAQEPAVSEPVVPAPEAAAPKGRRGRKPKPPKPPKKPKAPVKPNSDPDARTMKTTHGEFIDGYNFQLAVDAPSGFILGAVATNAPNDLNQMRPLLEATKKQSGLVPDQVVADAGYDSYQNHQAIADIGATGYVCPKKRGPSPFTRDENGVFRCLAGHEATSSTTHKDGVEYLTYRVSRCKGCPLAQACGKKGTGHQREMNIRSDEHAHLTKENRSRCAEEAGKELLKCRGQTVERANARMKRDLGLRRLILTGLKGARTELLMACIALNLQTLLKAIKRLKGQIAPPNGDRRSACPQAA